MGYAFIDRTGEVNIAKNGMKMTIIAYRRNHDIDVMFEDGYIAYNRTYKCFKSGTIKNPNVKISIPKPHLIKNRVGVTRMMNCGMEATCIAYRNTGDCDFKFKDGTVIEHRSFTEFKRGSLLNPNIKDKYKKESLKKRYETIGKKYIGKVFQTKYGMSYKVIQYTSKNEVLIEFNDGYQMVIQVQRLGSSIQREDLLIVSKNGRSTLIKIGDTRLMKCGLKATIIEAKSANDINIKFENGVIKEHVRFSAFEQGKITPMKSNTIRILVGDKFMTCKGEEFEIIEKIKSLSIVRFKDGTIRDVETKRIKNGMNLSKHKIKRHSDEVIGKWYDTNCGLKCKVLKWVKKNTVVVEYEDGRTKEDVNIQALKKGQCAHPELTYVKGYNVFHGFKCQRMQNLTDTTYYTVFNDKDDPIGIFTLREIIELEKSKLNF